MNVAALLLEQARSNPDRVAILDRSGSRDRSVTFRELDAMSSSFSERFIAGGLRPGDHVAIVHPMALDLYVAIAGMLRAGLVPTFCDPGAGRETLDSCFDRVECAALFASLPGFAYAAMVPSLRRVRRRYGPHRVRQRRYASAIVDRDVTDPALVTFTSGSTGVPKVVVRSHGLLAAQLDAIRRVAAAVDVEVSTMPIVLLTNLASGMTSVIPRVDLRRPGVADPQRLADDILQTGATSIVASPAMLENLSCCDVGTRLDGLRRIVTGGGPVMPQLMRRLQQVAPSAKVLAIYGSTEAEPIAYLALNDISEGDIHAMQHGRGLLVGKPVVDVRIIRGEVVVAGPQVVTDRVWHRTGDGGYLDSLGRLWLTGRKMAEIRDDRGNLNPFAVECALSFEPRIARSALVGVRSKRVLAVEPVKGSVLTNDDVRNRISWATIDEVRFLRRLPVDGRHNAKIDYPALRRSLESCA